MSDTRTTADDIAGDLALAIHQGLIRPGEQLPPQTKLMASYGVAMGTAAAALAKLAAARLTRGEPGRGTFAVDRHRIRNPILDIMAAASMLRQIAATSYPPRADAPRTIPVGGDPAWNTPHEREHSMPPRQVDISALRDLDRHLLRWMSEAFLTAARRIVATGRTDTDTHLIEAARAILRDGGRPHGQPPIAIMGGPVPADEDVALRIWPERGRPPAPGEPPF